VVDILRSAIAYREQLIGELSRVDEFLRFSERLLRSQMADDAPAPEAAPRHVASVSYPAALLAAAANRLGSAMTAELAVRHG